MAQVILENIYKSFPRRKREASISPSGSKDLTKYNRDYSNGNRNENVSVLRRINLSVADGEFMVLLGSSGCGKSTLLRLIAGLEPIASGNIWVGKDLVNNLSARERDIAMVFQDYALYPHMTVFDNIAFGLRLKEQPEKLQPSTNFWQNLLSGGAKKMPEELHHNSHNSRQEKFIIKKVYEVAELLQIKELLHQFPKELSGGQKQRVALGRAIARNPKVFLMDEPLSNLDARLRAETRAQIVKLQRQLGITTIYVTHDRTEAMTMGDRIAILDRGQIQQVAPPLEIYNRPANLFVAEFIGSPPMNFIPVIFRAPLLITHGDFRMTLPATWENALQKYDGCSLILGIRPENWSIGVPATKNLPAQVELVENLGNDAYISFKLLLSDSPEPDFSRRNNLLQARISPERILQLGEEVWLSINPEKIHFFDPETKLAIFPRSRSLSLPFES
ncbi:ABC transporter ATP-binding protein [Mastigocoleus sp. MO_188.B34]|uniref:ABC transporter ATP-binding protein n=1 Tax=Mastigocoleus sp. MO_188.B34 TaxID=3036635 RepID=UPI002625C400|nr:ABC transporter ATP-binding protein [Mastigocoleus sp. MO_188.B34]MDJ0693881.1 ABC transporter ATP-binding protein [Mastigocoleus sp. MO_188.B34]